MTDKQQPEALRLADDLEASSLFPGNMRCCNDAAAEELRRQHARIAELEAQLSNGGDALPEGITRDDTVHGETYFTAADMATASAQGFRDGVASLAASAGSEPVASRAFLLGMQVFPNILAVQRTKRTEVVAMPIRKRRRNWAVRIHWEEVPAVFQMGNTLVMHPSIYIKMKKEFPSCP